MTHTTTLKHWIASFTLAAGMLSGTTADGASASETRLGACADAERVAIGETTIAEMLTVDVPASGLLELIVGGNAEIEALPCGGGDARLVDAAPGRRTFAFGVSGTGTFRVRLGGGFSPMPRVATAFTETTLRHELVPMAWGEQWVELARSEHRLAADPAASPLLTTFDVRVLDAHGYVGSLLATAAVIDSPGIAGPRRLSARIRQLAPLDHTEVDTDPDPDNHQPLGGGTEVDTDPDPDSSRLAIESAWRATLAVGGDADAELHTDALAWLVGLIWPEARAASDGGPPIRLLRFGTDR